MPQSVVVLDADLATTPLAGRTLADHWRAVLAEAALSPAEREGPTVTVDGRFPAVGAQLLRELATTLLDQGGAVVATDGTVVATARPDADPALGRALLTHPGGTTVVLEAPLLCNVAEEWGRSMAEVRIIAAVRRRLAGVGVRLMDPDRVWVEPMVRIAAGATLWGGCILRGRTRVARGAVIEAGAILDDTEVGVDTVIKAHSVCNGARIGAGCQVGPMAHLRPGAILEDDVKVGNFVEVKAAILRRGVRASHLSYLGDAEVGQRANVGAGTITCNYDGHAKHRTEIGPGAFIGSNTSLVAPIRVGAGAIVGAGSTITRPVPDASLVLERSEARLFEGRAPSIHARNRRRAADRNTEAAAPGATPPGPSQVAETNG